MATGSALCLPCDPQSLTLLQLKTVMSADFGVSDPSAFSADCIRTLQSQDDVTLFLMYVDAVVLLKVPIHFKALLNSRQLIAILHSLRQWILKVKHLSRCVCVKGGGWC